MRKVLDGALIDAPFARGSFAVQEGSVLCGGRDLFTLTEREMNAVRGAGISLIFQEPATSLNPVIRVGEQIPFGGCRR